MRAAQGGQSAAVSALLAAADAERRGPDGTTALMLATANGHVETAQELLAAKADVHARDDDGRTALAYAKQQSRSALVKLPTAAGAK